MPVGSVLTEAILGIAAIIVASLFAGVYFTGVNQVMDAEQLHIDWLKDRLSHECMILHVYATTDSNTITLWIKNVGTKAVSQELLKKSELMIISQTRVYYLLYGGSGESWTFKILNDVDSDDRWDRGETIQVKAFLNSTLTSGDYQVSFILYNGVKCSQEFSPYAF